MRRAARGWFLLLPALLGATGGCGDPEPPGCRGEPIPLARTPLTSLPDVRLHRVGDGFLLVGSERAGALLRVARLSRDGKLGSEIDLLLPTPAVGPFVAPVGKNAPGDQVVVIHGAARPDLGGAVALQIQALDVPPSEPTAPPQPRLLLDDARPIMILPAEVSVFRGAIGGSPTGMRAAFTFGRGPDWVPETLILGPDGQSEALPPGDVPGGTRWDCLAVTAGRSAFGVSWIERPVAGDRHPVWRFADLREDGGTAYTLDVETATREMGCPAVGPTSKGYVLAWQNRDGTYFSSIDTTRDELLLVSDFVKAAVRFGGPAKQPGLGCIGPMGKDFAIVYDDASGPIAERFNIFGNPQGSALHLPGSRVGPVSATPAIDALYFTYLARQPGRPLDTRYFVRTECTPP